MSVVDREALKEALGYFDWLAQVAADWPDVEENGAPILAAARSVLEGEAIDWCEVHKRPATETTCGAWQRRAEDNYNMTGVTGCVLVRVVVVPIEGE